MYNYTCDSLEYSSVCCISRNRIKSNYTYTCLTLDIALQWYAIKLDDRYSYDNNTSIICHYILLNFEGIINLP